MPRADTYDPGCACPGQSHSREAFERLLQAGEGTRLVGLADAASPGARAFARDAMERTGGWTLERIEAALADEAVVESVHTPSRCDVHVEHLSTSGLEAALVHPDRAAIDPLLRAWAARGTPVGMAWISTRRLHRIVGDPEVTEEIRAAAASALAKRGERTPSEPLYRLARSASPWVARVAVETLDALGDAHAWAELAPAEPHQGYRVCVEPWTCPDHCVHLVSCEEHEGRVCATILRLGAHLVPDQAAAVIDLDAHGLEAVSALPPRLFATRASEAVCRWRWWEPQTEQERRNMDDLAAALAKLPPRVRCRALRVDGSTCQGPVEERAHAISPELAEGCGIDPPQVSPE